ncbi:MAG: hypothetical protein WA917_13790 [Comamonas sp.]
MAETYRIERIADLLALPKERRADCLRAIEYGLALAELTLGDGAADACAALEWKDDGNMSTWLCDADGNELLELEIIQGESK